MGNKILTQYDVNKEPCYYSVDLKWRLYSAKFKEKPDEQLTIFLFEKKVVEKYPKKPKRTNTGSAQERCFVLTKVTAPSHPQCG